MNLWRGLNISWRSLTWGKVTSPAPCNTLILHVTDRPVVPPLPDPPGGERVRPGAQQVTVARWGAEEPVYDGQGHGGTGVRHGGEGLHLGEGEGEGEGGGEGEGESESGGEGDFPCV